MTTEVQNTSVADRRELDDQFAFPMFFLSVVFLTLLAGIIITWVDMPRVAELAQLDAGTEQVSIAQSDKRQSDNKQASIAAVESVEIDKTVAAKQTAITEAFELAESAHRIGRNFFIALLCIWPLFWLEFAYNYTTARHKDGARKPQLQRLLVCLIPPLRIGTVSDAWGDRMWLLSLRWQHPGRDLSNLLSRIFSKPMLVIAMLILPILLIEFVFKSAVHEYFWLRMLMHLATGFIWLAFTLEFIIMISATSKKLSYIKQNWIDLVIILLPLVSFLRTLKVLRLARLAKIQKIAKLGRIYRVRSLGMKASRALMTAGFISRVLRISPEKRLAKLREQHQEQVLALSELKLKIDTIESSLNK